MTSRFWHGFADMHTVADAEVVIRSAEGVWIEDIGGNRYLDATAALGIWVPVPRDMNPHGVRGGTRTLTTRLDIDTDPIGRTP